MNWAHWPVLVYLFCYVLPTSFLQAGIDRKDLISVSTKGKFIRRDKTHMRETWTWQGSTSSGLMQLVFPNLLAWGKIQADTLQRTFHLTQSYATDLFKPLALATNGLNSVVLFLQATVTHRQTSWLYLHNWPILNDHFIKYPARTKYKRLRKHTSQQCGFLSSVLSVISPSSLQHLLSVPALNYCNVKNRASVW